MKNLITLMLFSISFISYAQKYTVVQINAEWNERNKIELPLRLEGAQVIYGHLRDQSSSLQESIKAVPVIILFKNNRPITQWTADISFKLNITKEEIANAIREDKQTYKRARSN